MPALNATLPFKQITSISKIISHQLNFYMSRTANVFLNKNTIIAKRISSLILSHLQRRYKIFFSLHHTHPFSSTTRTRLYQHRKSHLNGHLQSIFRVFNRLVNARNQRNPKRFNRLFRCNFATHHLHRFSTRPNQHQPLGFQSPRKTRIFTQETIPWMHCLSARLLTQFNDAIHPQITIRTGRTAHAISLIRIANMQRLNIGFTVNCNSFNAHLLASTHHPNGNLSAVGNQYFLKHE